MKVIRKQCNDECCHKYFSIFWNHREKQEDKNCKVGKAVRKKNTTKGMFLLIYKLFCLAISHLSWCLFFAFHWPFKGDILCLFPAHLSCNSTRGVLQCKKIFVISYCLLYRMRCWLMPLHHTHLPERATSSVCLCHGSKKKKEKKSKHHILVQPCA